MRVSFLAVLAVALLVGLGAVVAIKSLGLLATPTPPPPPPVQPVVTLPPPQPMVLVLMRPLFEGDIITAADVGRRPVYESEKKHYQEHIDDYFTDPTQIYLRFVARPIPGGKPLVKEDLQPIRKSDPLHDRLMAGTRAVNIDVTKQNAAGWLLSNGDWVDIHIITNVSRTDNPTAVRREGLIARNVLIVAKRDSLVTLYSPYRSDTFAYTLSMNPYRASLLEYCRTLGEITLEPVSKEEKVRLDKLLADAGNDPAKVALITMGDPNTREGMEEHDRVKEYMTTGLAVGTSDMMKALQLRPIEPPPPPYVPTFTEVEVFSGANQHKSYKFPVGRPELILVPPPAPQYIFSNPLDAIRTTNGGSSSGTKYEVKTGGLSPVPTAPKGGLTPPR